jgi:hypothetical protein
MSRAGWLGRDDRGHGLRLPEVIRRVRGFPEDGGREIGPDAGRLVGPRGDWSRGARGDGRGLVPHRGLGGHADAVGRRRTCGLADESRLTPLRGVMCRGLGRRSLKSQNGELVGIVGYDQLQGPGAARATEPETPRLGAVQSQRVSTARRQDFHGGPRSLDRRAGACEGDRARKGGPLSWTRPPFWASEPGATRAEAAGPVPSPGRRDSMIGSGWRGAARGPGGSCLGPLGRIPAYPCALRSDRQSDRPKPARHGCYSRYVSTPSTLYALTGPSVSPHSRHHRRNAWSR